MCLLALMYIFLCSQYLMDILESSCYRFLSVSLCRVSSNLLPVSHLCVKDVTMFDTNGKWTFLLEIMVLVSMNIFHCDKVFIFGGSKTYFHDE
jgi:hypothetical protein